MFIRCRYTVSWLHMFKTQEKAVCCCCLMHVFMQRSKEKQLEAKCVCFRLRWAVMKLFFSDASSTHWWWKSGNIVDYFGVNNVRKFCLKERPVWSWRLLCVFFLLLMDLKDALGQLAAFSVRHLVLLFMPFLLLAQGGICIFFFCWCTFNTKPRSTNREEAGSI